VQLRNPIGEPSTLVATSAPALIDRSRYPADCGCGATRVPSSQGKENGARPAKGPPHGIESRLCGSGGPFELPRTLISRLERAKASLTSTCEAWASRRKAPAGPRPRPSFSHLRSMATRARTATGRLLHYRAPRAEVAREAKVPERKQRGGVPGSHRIGTGIGVSVPGRRRSSCRQSKESPVTQPGVLFADGLSHCKNLPHRHVRSWCPSGLDPPSKRSSQPGH
jgi:hypothetical protein